MSEEEVHVVTDIPEPPKRSSVWFSRTCVVLSGLFALTFLVWDMIDRLGPVDTHKCTASGCVVALHTSVILIGMARVLFILSIVLFFLEFIIVKLWYASTTQQAPAMARIRSFAGKLFIAALLLWLFANFLKGVV